MRLPEVIFFDLFNTLIYAPIDSNPYSSFFYASGIRSPRLLKIADTIVSTNDLPTFEDVAKKLNLELPENHEEIRDIVKIESSQISVFDDVHPVLPELIKRGHRLAIISNSVTPYKQALYNNGIHHYFEAILFSCDNNVGYTKPGKEIFHLACERMRSKPEICLHIGDSLKSDVFGALGAGLNALFLNRNQQYTLIPNIESLTELIQ